MFSPDFVKIVKATDGAKLDARVNSGASKWLTEGDHMVRVSGVDKNRVKDNMLTLKWEDANAKDFQDMYFLANKNRKTGEQELSWRFANLLAALIPGPEALDAFMAEVAAGNVEVLDLFVGLQAKITVGRGPGYGYAVRSTDAGGNELYTIHDALDGTVVIATAPSIDEAQKAAEDKGWKKSYLRVTAIACTHGPENIDKFAKGLSSLHKPKATMFAKGAAAV